MNQFKKAQVIMLPTNKSNIALTNSIKEYGIGSTRSENYLQGSSWVYQSDINGKCKPQHLYITSDDEIKEGDWVICNGVKDNIQRVIEINEDDELELSKGHCLPKILCKKIIATTNTSLIESIEMIGTGSTYLFKLPQPSQQFIEQYIESYNKGEVITDVLVEYESYHGTETSIAEINCISGDNSLNWKGEKRDYKLKINPKDNTITIKKLKDSWNREELINIVKKVYYDAEISNCGDTVENWIKENL